jgi:hypothetical protein
MKFKTLLRTAELSKEFSEKKNSSLWFYFNDININVVQAQIDFMRRKLKNNFKDELIASKIKWLTQSSLGVRSKSVNELMIEEIEENLLNKGKT